MPKLGLNIDHIATLRQARYRGWKRGLAPEPNIVQAAQLARQSGVDSITVHLREDRRHIQEADVRDLIEALSIRVNLEMAATAAMTRQALSLNPDEVCLVPEGRAEITTEGGLDVAGDLRRIKTVVGKLKRAKIRVSIFIDADPGQVEAAKRAGADDVELHTGAYANAVSLRARHRELARHGRAAGLAHELGLRVNAGHGLHYTNVREYLENVPHLRVLNIGHSIISRAIFTGLGQAIEEMRALLVTREFVPYAD